MLRVHTEVNTDHRVMNVCVCGACGCVCVVCDVCVRCVFYMCVVRVCLCV